MLTRFSAALLLILACSSQFALAQTVPDRCNRDTGTGCNMSEVIGIAGMPLQGYYQEGKFAQIDASLKEECAGQRLTDGQPRHLIFLRSFTTMFGAWKRWDFDRVQLEKWRKSDPNSLAESLVEAMYWQSYAWHLRGGGYASSVPKEAWELFYENMAKAVQRLEDSKARSSQCPLWHTLYIEMLLESGAQREKVLAAWSNGAQLFPQDELIHMALARALSPRWGGSDIEFDTFARRVSAVAGQGMYSRLYWTQDCNCDEAILFGRGKSQVDWKLMKAGFEDLLKQYPDDLWNRNKYASFACRANDRQAYGKLRKEIGAHIYNDLWPSSWSVEVCDKRMFKQS